MKSIFSFKYLFLLSGIALFLTSCGTDTVDTTNPASVSLVDGTDYVTADATVGAGTVFYVKVKGSQGDATMKALTIKEDGVNVPYGSLTINGSAANANPILLPTADKSSFEYVIGVTAHTTIGTKNYSFIVLDDDNKESSKSFNITTTGDAPTLTLNGNPNITLSPSSFAVFSLKGVIGTANLTTIQVQEDANIITALSRLEYDGTVFTSNPQGLVTADGIGFTDLKIGYRAPATPGTYVVTIFLGDAAGLFSDALNINVTVGSPISELTGKLLKNQGGPSGTGGIDLDTGDGTGSTASSADLRDEGIDSALPAASNWKKQVSGVNGSTVKYIKAGQNGVSESFTFEGVSSAEELTSLWSGAIDFTKTNGTRPISDVINVGDVLIVSNNSKYYLVKVTNIVLTTTDNNDYYELSIKQK